MKVYVVTYDIHNVYDPEEQIEVYATLELAQEAMQRFIDEYGMIDYESDSSCVTNGVDYCRIIQKEVIEKRGHQYDS